MKFHRTTKNHVNAYVHFALLVLINIAFHEKSTGQHTESYYFSPGYTLPGNAGNYPGTFIETTKSKFQQFKAKQSTPDFKGYQATEIIDNFIENPFEKNFAIEFSLVHHFNKPAGIVFYFTIDQNPLISFNYHAIKDRSPVEVGIFDFEHDQELYRDTLTDFYQRYWHHFVLRYKSRSLCIFHNGVKVSDIPLDIDLNGSDLKIAAYLQDEPHSMLKNVLDYLTIHRENFYDDRVDALYKEFQNKLENGIIFFDTLHFNAGPYLHFATDSSINMVWETNVPCQTVIEYGEVMPLSDKITIKEDNKTSPFIYETTLSGLKPDQKYFYNLTVKSESGEQLESGVLTLKTATSDDKPLLFGLIGDTETRPYINDIVAKRLWAERPEFVVLLGDLTDGGMQDAKWQWNLEYFTGITQLFSRVAVFPVPGNGEGDLYWYKKYHKLPESEAYYTFSYGDAAFFMLNSNKRKTEFSPGGRQFDWLDSALEVSSRTWKFVALHHAPYSTDENDYGNTYTGNSNLGDEHVRPLVPLFEKHQVDAVFFGHLHSYNRIGPIRNNQFDQQHGVWYIQAGGAGGNLEDFAPTRTWFSQKTYSDHHYCTVSIIGYAMQLKTYNLDGQLIDFMTITK